MFIMACDRFLNMFIIFDDWICRLFRIGYMLNFDRMRNVKCIDAIVCFNTGL